MALWLLALVAVLAAWARPALALRPRCPSHTPQRCVPGGSGQNEYSYTVDGVKLKIEFTDSGYFTLTCRENLTLDNSALPRFESQLRVKKVQLKDCPAPRGSYAATLDALNVLVLDRLKLIKPGTLTPIHLTGLTHVHALELIDAELTPRTLGAPRGLQRLLLDNVRLPPGELASLPRSLELLYFMRMATDLPAAVLEGLPKLVNVTVLDSHNVSVALAGAVQVLALQMPAARVASALSPALRSLTVSGWDEPAPQPWSSCALRTLTLLYVTATKLPADWLRACAELRVLQVQDGPGLRALHATALHGAYSLQELELSSCALSALPTGLLDDAVNLTRLDLSGNFLKELPGGLFVKTTSLQWLSLAKNRLTTDVYTSLEAVTSLTTLILSNNDLKDSCGGGSDTVRGVSPLAGLNKLTHLDLRKTNASLICRDWRENMPLLETLVLADNNFTSVTYADLQFRGRKDVDVDLARNRVRRLHYTRHDYALAVGAGPASRAVVELGAALACDCRAYWAARALRDAPARVRAACAGGPALRAVPLARLTCDARDLCAGTPCACAWHESGRAAPERVLRVSCERAGLRDARATLARLARNARAPDEYDWQLHLAHNRIAELDAADFPKHLSILDLTNNSLSVLSADTARALLADGRHVTLARNPLDCGCATADVRAAMRARQAALPGYGALACAGGAPLAGASLLPCAGPGAAALAAGAALAALLAAAALAALLWHPAARLRLKAALHARGWLPRAAEPDARRYDVFLSFSHGDERFVRDELVARLEAGPAPYRLCVHYRDWAPGGWIPAQIAASVRASRRTVAVVSEHFLRSAWARAEFREAYALALRDARPRLVVVLLADPAALPLDDKLRRYLATNTYVRWGDPWFWQKLRLALPRGRGLEPVEGTGPAPVEGAEPAPIDGPEPAPTAGPGPDMPWAAAPHVAIEMPPAACPQLSTTSSLSSADSSSYSSADSPGPSSHCNADSPAISAPTRLVSPPSCGAHYAHDVSQPSCGAHYAHDVSQPSCGAHYAHDVSQPTCNAHYAHDVASHASVRAVPV